MDKLQVLALMLELAGFGLAYLHVFREKFVGLASRKLEKLTDLFFSHAGMYQADYDDPSASMDERDAMAMSNLVLMLLYLVLVIVAFVRLDFGAGIWWGILELLAAMIIGGLAAFIVQALLVLAVNGVVLLVRLAGNGNLVAGVGFALAMLGICLEAYQVWQSRFKWVAVVVPGFAVMGVVFMLLRRHRVATGR